MHVCHSFVYLLTDVMATAKDIANCILKAILKKNCDYVRFFASLFFLLFKKGSTGILLHPDLLKPSSLHPPSKFPYPLNLFMTSSHPNCGRPIVRLALDDWPMLLYSPAPHDYCL